MTSREKSLEELQEMLDYRFEKPELLREATTHRSSSEPSNERLEFLGDAVLGLLIGNMLYGTFTCDEEGLLSKKRSILVRTASLARMAQELHIGDCLALGNGEEMCGGRHKEHILEDAFEAVLGAVFADGGYEAAKRVVERLFRQQIAEVDRAGTELRDYKSALQERVQAVAPNSKLSYRTVRTEGPPHAPQFTVELQINGASVSSGAGTSKKGSEQAAAHAALSSFDALVLPLLHVGTGA